MPIDCRPTVEVPDDDPYLWLEEVEGARALAWVEEQNRRTLAHFDRQMLERDRDVLASIFDRPDRIPMISRRGSHVYNFWKDANHKRGLWRRTTLDKYMEQTKQPSWDVILDIDVLALTENEDWQWDGVETLPGEHNLALVRLSRGGGDAVVIREFNIPRREFVADGFNMPEAKGSVEWLDQHHLLISSTAGSGLSTRSGYPRTVRLWCRGEPLAQAAVLFETLPTSKSVYTSINSRATADGDNNEQVIFIEELSRFDINVLVGSHLGPKVKLDLPTDISVEFNDRSLAVKRNSAWQLGETTVAPDTVLGISLERFLAGDRNYSVLFQPTPRRALRRFFWRNNFLVIAILDDLMPVFELAEPSENGWKRSELRGLPKLGRVDVWPLDAETLDGNGELLASAEDSITPSRLFLIERQGTPVVLKESPQTFVSDGLVISRHEALSADGEGIPYLQIGPRENTGSAPVHLFGYGGFGFNVLSDYDSSLGKLWLERGGTAVIAQIRGGGEFGSWWHEAARRTGRKLAFADFAAVAEDLVKRNVTRPERIAGAGTSNGGLMIANMMVRYPDKFGALLCVVPLLDMRRYSKLLAGANWIAEYGDPDRPEDWSFLKETSAYHNAIPNGGYPPILLLTFKKDDRVHPGHARKMAAKLQSMGYDAYFYEFPSGGHANAENFQLAECRALGYAFLRQHIGWTN